MKLSPNGLHEALALLGEYLDGRALRYDLVIVGGGALLLQGLSRRATADLDVVARFGAEGLTRAQPLPEPLVRAVRDVGRALGLADDWLNDGPEDLLRLGLPPGF